MHPAFALAVASLVSMEVAAEPIVAVPGIFNTFPEANGEAPHPRNLRPLAFGVLPSTPVFTLTRGDSSAVTAAHDVVDAALRGGAPGGVFAVTLPVLDAGEAITLEAACDGCAPNPHTWVIGTDVDDVAPAFGDGTGRFTFTGNDGGNGLFGRTGFEVELCVPALQADEPVMLRMSGDALGTPRLGFGSPLCTDGSSGLATSFLIDGGQPRDVCVDVVAIDAAGNESAPLTVCDALEASEGGCAATPTPTVAMMGLLLLLRRRRR
jgi:uncharacterized protein (TIGR03382 family)